MGSSPNNWTNGHSIYQIVAPESAVVAGYTVQFQHYGPLSAAPDLFAAENLGAGYGGAQAGSLLTGLGAPINSTTAAYARGIRLPSTQYGQIQMGQLDMSGVALDLTTSATTIPFGPHSCPGTTGDVKCINWLGDAAHDQVMIYPGATGNGLTINDPNAPTAISIANNTAVTGTMHFPSSGAGYSWTLPPVSGNVLMDSQVAGPGQLTRTLPGTVNNEVDIGTFASSDGSGEFVVYLSGTADGAQANKIWTFATSYNQTGSSWYTVTPLLSQPLNASTWDVALDVQVNTFNVALRLRNIAGTSTPSLSLGVYQYGEAMTFTPSTSTGSVSAPTAWMPSAVVTQQANQLLVTNATGYAATIDPTNITAARSYPLPDVSGTPGVFPASAVINSAVCIKSASPLSLGYCSSVVGVGGTCTCNQRGGTIGQSKGSIPV